MDTDDYDMINYTNYDKKKKYNKIYNEDNDNYMVVNILNNLNSKIKDIFLEGDQVERVIHFDFKLWLKDMKQSFSDYENIKKQFKLDCYRSNFYCNGNLIQDPDELIHYLENKCDKFTLCNILMFCTQASLAIPYQIIKEGLNQDDFIYHLSELSINEDYNLLKKYQINFDFKKDEINFKVEKILRVFKLENHTDKTISLVTISLDFNFKDRYVILKIYYRPINL